MKVYSLIGIVENEGNELVGVFATAEDLLEFADNMERDEYDRYEYFDQLCYAHTELGQRVVTMEDIECLRK